MTRQLTITAAEWASQDAQGRLWLVGERTDEWTWLPPVEFVQACAPCETCNDEMCFHEERSHGGGDVAEIITGPCPDCRIELVGPCPDCRGSGHIPADLSKGEFWHCEACGGTNTATRRKVGIGRRTLGHAYAVGQPLPIVDAKSQQAGEVECIGVWRDPYPPTVHFPADLRKKGTPINLAHAGPPESLIGKWAMCIEVKKERT